jgi:hypothetical protein
VSNNWHLTGISDSGLTLLAYNEAGVAELAARLAAIGVPEFTVSDNRGGDGGWTFTISNINAARFVYEAALTKGARLENA